MFEIACGALSRARAHNEIDVAVENLQQGHELI